MSHLHAAIRRVLLEEWDPIGVDGVTEASDEYDAYAAHLYGLLLRRASLPEIVDYLSWAETQHMLLPGDRQRAGMVAESLLRLITGRQPGDPSSG